MARFKHYLISEKLDLSAFHKPYKNDAEGRPAYDTAILRKAGLRLQQNPLPWAEEKHRPDCHVAGFCQPADYGETSPCLGVVRLKSGK